jgi:hypothetical protein
MVKSKTKVKTDKEMLIPSEGSTIDVLIIRKIQNGYIEFSAEVDYAGADFRISKSALFRWLYGDNAKIKK